MVVSGNQNQIWVEPVFPFSFFSKMLNIFTWKNNQLLVAYFHGVGEPTFAPADARLDLITKPETPNASWSVWVL